MPGRTQALMRTRCPACGTVFRVTSEQLRLKAGKVRCGQCQTVFNAFDEFLPEEPLPDNREPAPESSGEVPEQEPGAEPKIDEPATEATGEVTEEAIDEAGAETSSAEDVLPDRDETTVIDALPAAEEWPGEMIVDNGPETEPLPETPEASTQAARQAGLVAARELADAPAYNRWAAAALDDPTASSFALAPARRLVWPFVIVAVLLALGLAAQLLLHFRSDVVRWLPAAGSYFQQLGIDVPLPRNPDLVIIEASDLQADNARGLFVLQATLHNRAAYAQAWPALELTLTDAGDRVVARRVMGATDYLPPTISPELFPANGEVAVRLWIEARDLGAAGYRLYVFYP